MFKGSIVALVTPMHPDGSIDTHALEALVEWHIAAKTDGILIAGSTGESATLEPDEQQALIALVVRQVNGRIPVIAGAGTSGTDKSLNLITKAKNAGADACLTITPYYNRPTQKGLYEHYETLARQGNHPIIIYNNPVRTACDILPETIERLSSLPNIIGIKEATGKVERALEIKQRCPDDFYIYSGDDATALELLCAGAHGVISVTANIAPTQMHEMCQAVFEGDKNKAEQINQSLMLLHKNLFIQSNPIPVKWALHMLKKIEQGIRLPLLPLEPQYYPEIKNAMKTAGVQ